MISPNGKPVLSVGNFAIGLLGGLVEFRPQQRYWRLRDLRGHAAAKAAYEYLSNSDRFELGFAIYLDPVYGTCPIWSEIVTPDGLLLRAWDNDFEIIRAASKLGYWSRRDLPGDSELWTECARVFAGVHDSYDPH